MKERRREVSGIVSGSRRRRYFYPLAQHLGLKKGCQARDVDAIIASTTIVMARYMFLAREQRRHDDPRTFGLLVHACCEEMRDLDYQEALKRILTWP